MAWPKGVPRKQNVDKEAAINPFHPKKGVVVTPEAMSSGEAVHPDTGETFKQPEAPPHYLERQTQQKPFHDRNELEDNYAKYLGLESSGDQKVEDAADRQEPTPPTEADTGVQQKSSETITVKQDEPVTAVPESTPIQQPEPTPPTTPTESVPLKYKTHAEAEKAAKEAERKMHEATQERARIEAEKKSLEAFNKQMLEVLQAIKTSPSQPTVPKPEEIELTPEQKTELIINNPDEFERILTEKAERRILAKIEERQRADNEAIQLASRQRGLELFVRMGEQHFENNYQDMKIYEPFVKEEAEKILKSPDARELISRLGPQGLIDTAVTNTKSRIEQIRQSLAATGTIPPATPAVPAQSTEVRTPLPASPVVRPSGVVPAPPVAERVIPTAEQQLKDYVAERNAWREQRGLG
jgi:hypothetical protein